MAYGVTLTAPTITGTHTDMPVLITEDDLPSDAYNSANQIDNGGGNLVAYTDSTKTTQLPIEVVSFVTGASPDIQVWVKRTMATGNTIYLEADTVQTAQPAVTSTYGRNAVWSDYDAVYHLEEAVNTTSGGYIDSAGSNDATGVSMALTEVSGQIGKAQDFDGSADLISVPSGAMASARTNNALTVSAWSRYDSTSADGTIVGRFGSSNQMLLYVDVGGTVNYRFGVGDSSGGTTFTDTTSANSAGVDTWELVHGTWDGTTASVYTDGSLSNSTSSARTINTGALDLGIGSQLPTASRLLDGKIDEVRFRGEELSSDWIATEYANQSTATWFSNDGWADSGGGGTDNLLADDVSSNSELTSPSVGQTHGLLSVSVESLSELSSPAITQTHALLSVSVESLSELTLPALATPDVLTADDVESTSELTSPQIAQVHNILGDDVQSLTELTTPALGQVHSLTSVSVESASELTAPVLFQPQEDALLAEDVESLSELSTPSLREGLGPIVQGSGNWFIGTNGRYYVNKI